MDIHNEFIAQEKNLVFYKGKDILNRVQEIGEWDFTDITDFTMKIWEEREGGREVISWSSPNNLSSDGSTLILNAPATDTNIELGKYYYEIEYLLPGGYAVLISYGEAIFI